MSAAWIRPRLRRFAQQDDGSLIVFSLFLLLCMFLFTGLAIDVMRTETARTKLQNTLDRAVLAAADLDQPLNAQDVVNDYFTRAGVDNFLATVNPTSGLNFKTVEATASAEMGTRFIPLHHTALHQKHVGEMAGPGKLTAAASGTANETVTDVEISLVLDNSGSMNSNNRLNLLKAAANDFLDIVIKDDGASGPDDKVSINIVPFATQVSAGPSLLSHFNVTTEHSYSHCVNFSASDFTSASLSLTDELQRTGHFDVQSWTDVPRYGAMNNRYLTCPSGHDSVNTSGSNIDSRYITFMGDDKDTLKSQINSMWAGGNTSIDVATKWGLALLDPAARPIVNDQIASGKVNANFTGRPFSYTEDQVMKVLVVMSDGENTSQYTLRSDYRTGDSPLFRDSSNGRETYYYNRSYTSYDYFYVNGDYWRTQPYYDWSRAQRMTWPEVWAYRSVASFSRYVQYEALGGSWANYYYSYWTSVTPSTKNTRTSQICQAAKDQGVTVYTIGMDTYGQGDATLSDCATSTAFFFDVDGLEIGEAFAAIARDINRLRLTH
ncbi:MAG: Tad domain-containing protein [Pseudomonadota bacterium]